MPKKKNEELKDFQVNAEVTISVHTRVMARNKKEAIELAAQQPMIHLCSYCSEGDASVNWVTSGELDGEPRNLVAESDE